ncbi:protocadherin-15-like [Spea bombifrons]|uniref:protocadherin-15-like n=1 Tax=Spea bombifrons TaxID=233779 RepID=UPI0023499A35|nr:protocadherin-15-like [Spea bombifrons]
MEPSPFLAAVLPSAGPGTRVYKLHAMDKDEGMSGEVEYFLLEGGEDRFVVDRSTGWIRTTNQSLQEGQEYLLNVQAADKLGMRGSPAVVSVIAGVRPPQFKQASYTVHVSESAAPGSTLVTVSAISHQSNPLSYGMVAGPQSLFSVDRITGQVTLIRAVDFESDPQQFLLGVTAAEKPTDLKSTVQVAQQTAGRV